MKRILRILLAALIIFGIGGFIYYQSRVSASAAGAGDETSYTQIVQVQTGSLSSTLSVVGQLEAEQSSALAFDYVAGSTELLTLAVEAGNTVTQGQVLAGIDPAPYQQALDQAQSDLQAAEESLADLQAPATALAIAQADTALAKAQQTLEQAKADLADLNDPDLTTLQNAVQDAQDTLTLLAIQDDLAGRDALAKSERDLQYSVSWYERRIAELQALSVPTIEQVDELAEDQEALAEAQTDLARVQVQRELARQARAAELAQAQVVLAEAQKALAEAKAGSDALTLTQAQLAVHQAEVGVQAAQEARQALDEGADEVKLAAAQAAVDKKRLAVSQAQAALDGAQMVAPFDGVILETYISAGNQVSANTIVLELANLSTQRVVASVDETTIRQVSEGQSASITFDAFPGQTFSGQVLAVPLQGALQGGVMVYEVPISLTGADDLPLLIGMTANVEIHAGDTSNALLVPTMALQQSNGQYQVLVSDPDDPAAEPEVVTVAVGLSDGAYTEVTGDLSAGDNVVVQLESSTSSSSGRMGGSSNILMSVSRQLGG